MLRRISIFRQLRLGLIALTCCGSLQANPMAATEAATDTTEPINVYLFDNFAPFSYSHEGRPAGLYFDVVEQAFSRANIPAQFIIKPFNSGLDFATSGYGLIAGLLKTPEREEARQLIFSERFFTEKTLLYVRKDSQIALDTDSPLYNLRYQGSGGENPKIAITRGWTYGAEFDQARISSNFFRPINVESEVVAFKMLLHGLVDIAVGDQASSNKTIGKYKLKRQVRALKKIINQGDIHLAGRSNHQHAITRFNQQLAIMEDDGSLKKIIQKYGINLN